MTTGAVARLLGVSPVTLRSWDRRYGLGPADRRAGGHRRWRPADLAVLREMCRLTASGVPPAEAALAARQRDRRAAGEPGSLLPVVAPSGGRALVPPPRPDGAPGAADGTSRAGPPPGTPGAVPPPAPLPSPPPPLPPLSPAEVRRECRGLARAAVRLDAPAMEDLLATLVGRFGPVAAWEEVMVPVLHAVGRTWETSGDRYVEVEHLLSWHVSTALRRAPARTPDSASRGPVLLACVPDEQHSLALEALAAALGGSGLAYRMLGAAVPVEALGAAVRRTGPAAVVLWSQSRSTANVPLARDVAATGWGVRGARTAPAVLTAGPGWAGPRPAGVLRPLSLREAVTALNGVCATGPAPGAGPS
ncbi:MerR family transcriptional regulator [Streptomyces ficellus]|uniref:MerR family transcriptional regulator n=1 Tax=Streptomyces ficellus TaxID=1977088 RepID=A0A6I6FWP7_9ACTN|nr:MerR family transcriptional regulator [Streptomyces ficellus]QGV82376.1 MerR family transcriptional regulator [Streptomyces ficellus]